MSHDLSDDLRREILEGNAVFVVGAGVSIAATNGATCASWTGLLNDGVARCEAVVAGLPEGWATRVRGEIASGDIDELLSAAEKITGKLGGRTGGEYGRWLADGPGALQAVNDSALDALVNLGVPLATTNYDGLLGQASGLPAVTWDEGARVERVIRGDERGILHLHGYWSRPQSVVLGIRSYESVLGNAHAQTVLRALQTLRTLVFVGFGAGLADPNFGALLQWTGQVFSASTYRRFRLTTERERVTVQAQHPASQRIVVVSYGNDFGDLATFLRSLESRSTPRRTAKSGTRSSSAPSFPPPPLCFGRDAELREIVANLLRREPVPVPILGPPGIGKSTLALAAAHEPRVVERFGARRYFVRCDGVTSRRALVEAIGDALGLPPSESLQRIVLDDLAQNPALVIVDNAETPWQADTEAVEELLGLLGAIPGSALVVAIRGNERPAGVRWHPPFHPAPLPLTEARSTFLSISGNRFSDDVRLDDVLDAVDGLPLAIALMAHQAQGEPDLDGLWNRWQEQRTRMLRRAAAADRLTNIELSYELSIRGPWTTDVARRLLSLLALLPAGLPTAAMDDILPGVGFDAAAGLRKAGLAFDQDGRLRVLAPLREYTRRLYPPLEADLARIVTWYAALVKIHGDAVGTTQGSDSARVLLGEAPNVEPIIELALNNPDPEAGIDAACAWARFVTLTGVGSAAIVMKAVDAAERAGRTLDHARAIESLGDIAFARSRNELARTHFQDALVLYRQVGSSIGEANCIYSLGDIALELGGYDEATSRYEEALPLYRASRDRLGEANCIQRLGDIAAQMNEADVARARFEEALGYYRHAGHLVGEANAIKSLGDIALENRDFAEAESRTADALGIYRAIGSVTGEANCIRTLGDIAVERDEPGTAQVRFEEALALYARIPEPFSMGWTFVRLARLAEGTAAEQGYVDSARQSWQQIQREDLLAQLDEEFGSQE